MDMSALERLIPCPRLIETDHADVAAPADQVWQLVRHGDLARSPIVRALFALRTLPARLAGHPAEAGSIRLDDLVSTPSAPGFQILGDDPPHEVAIGAIGEVWKPDIPFRHVDGAAGFADFAQPGWVKVAWAIRVAARGPRDSRVEVEVRVDATDEAAWRKFRRYFRLIGPASHFIRRSLLSALGRELGLPQAGEQDRALAGDELLADAAAQVTDGIDIRATPEEIWPWLVQMGCRRAGFYSIDLLDNGGARSAREIHPELQRIAVGQVLPATPGGDDGFEVLRVEAPNLIVLGGLFDGDAGRQLPFEDARPARYWHVTWTFALERLDRQTTRLVVRARAAFSPDERLHAVWIRPVHRLMQAAQLRNLAARAEGRQRRDDWRDVLEGFGGAARIALSLLRPFGRRARRTWGVSGDDLTRVYPGDDVVPAPRWMWTHAVDIDAPAAEVWPWVAQVGADRAGFYSYQWLENLAGCQLRNAESVHPEWQVHERSSILLNPRIPPFEVVACEPGAWFVAHAAPRESTAGGGWIAASWLFMVEPLGADRCRFFSRYRVDCSRDLVTRLEVGPALVEPVGFAMDRRMLLGVKERAERARRSSGQSTAARARSMVSMSEGLETHVSNR